MAHEEASEMAKALLDARIIATRGAQSGECADLIAAVKKASETSAKHAPETGDLVETGTRHINAKADLEALVLATFSEDERLQLLQALVEMYTDHLNSEPATRFLEYAEYGFNATPCCDRAS
jgi:hypothetical protein